MNNVNGWLAANPAYEAIRVESFDRKLTMEGAAETEGMVYFEPSVAQINYVVGLR